MSTPLTTARRRRVAIIGSAAVLAVAAVAITAAATSGGSSTPSRYHDYTGNSANDDQCAKPVAERTGGWVCP